MSPKTPQAESPPTLNELHSLSTVLFPGDHGYDEHRMVFHPGFDRRPAAIIVAKDTAEVARTVDIARRNAVELAVRSGGHSSAGHSTTEGGLLLDLRDLTDLAVDVTARTVRVGAGLTTGEITAATTRHGLAVPFGDSAGVGVSGLTLGGGLGYLARKHGLTIDSLLAAEIVTADGRARNVDERSEPDLFWAIRGGGGNMGVVTSLTFRLHDVSRFCGRQLVLRATPRVVAAFVRLARQAPNELTTIANVLAGPPLPLLPASAHGEPVVTATLAWTGDPHEGEHVLRRFQSLGEPLADPVAQRSYAELFPAESGNVLPRAAVRTMFLDAVDEHWAARALDWTVAAPGNLRVVQLRVLGGAVADVPADATAFAHRTASVLTNLTTTSFAAHDGQDLESDVEAATQALRQGRPRTFVNFLSRTDAASLRAAYPSVTWDRLVEIKSTYDPTNLFRLNHNVPPRGDR